MEKIVVHGVELEFQELTGKVQKRIWEANKDKKEFIPVFAKSSVREVRLSVLENKDLSSEFLKEMFKNEVNSYQNSEAVIAIYDHPNFQKDDDAKAVMSKLSDSRGRRIIARDISSSTELLNKMLVEEVKEGIDRAVAEDIIANPNFKMEEKTREVLASSSEWICRQIAAADEDATSEQLNKMLIAECENYQMQDDDVIKTIFEHPNFKMEEKTRKLLMTSEEVCSRIIIAEDESTTAQMLEEMFKSECNGEEEEAVLDAIISNCNFEYQGREIDYVKVIYLLKELRDSKEVCLHLYTEKILNMF